MKVLFLTTVLPARKLHGSEIASQNIVDALSQNGYDVSVVGYLRKEDGEAEATVQEICVAERYVETKNAKINALFWMSFSLLKNLPYSSGKYYSQRYRNTVRSLLSREKYDAVVIDHSQLGWLLDFIEGSKIVLVAHNVESHLYSQHLGSASRAVAKWVYAREVNLMERMEEKLAESVKEVWTLTTHDAAYFASLQKACKVRVLDLPSGFSGSQSATFSKQFDVGIIGSWPWKPNEEGLLWFLETVYPRLPTDISIHVAGRGADWLAGKYPNIIYRGFVPSAQEFMSQAKAVAIPILSGGGIQIKTLDAIAAGSSIVATSIALRGISDPPLTVQVADNDKDFSDALMSAILAASTDEARQSAQQWFQTRQQKFMADIAQALHDVVHS